jgi:hypothetical protein
MSNTILSPDSSRATKSPISHGRLLTLAAMACVAAVVMCLPVAGGEDLTLLRLLFGRVRDDDAADVLLAFLEALDNDAVVQRSDIHALFSVLA